MIAGGTGGVGLAIAKWMIKERGAKNILLLSRSGIQKETAAKAVAKLRGPGIFIDAPECNITDISSLASALGRYRDTLPPIAGCIQASMILRVSILIAASAY